MATVKALDAYSQLLDNNSPHNCFYYHRQDSLQSRGLEFIKNYLRDGGKLSLIAKEKEIFATESFRMRCEHMRSLFLLGVYCYDNIANMRKAIDNLIEKVFRNACEDNKKIGVRDGNDISTIPTPYNQESLTTELLRKDFLYMWYLICLYHDIGYVYERNALPPEQIFPNDIFAQHKTVAGIPSSYFNSIDRYYRLRRFTPLLGSRPCVDHGIYGGMRFYKTLQSLHSSSNIQVAEFGDNDGLLWGKPIFDNYIVPAAYCIACHNMFKAFVGSRSAQKYLSIDLEDLIIAHGTSDILPSTHPLLFLLCLLDSIEPVKIFAGDNPTTSADVDQILERCELQTGNEALHISWNPNRITIGTCRGQCQYKRDTGKCATYSCMRTSANNLDFLLSKECQVSVDAKWLKITINAWPAVAR